MNFKISDLLIKNNNTKPINIAIAGSDSECIIEALAMANKYANLKFYLVGEEKKTLELVKKYKLNNYEIINQDNSDLYEIGKKAVKLIKDGKADILVKGSIGTKYILTPVVDRNDGIRSSQVLSHVAMCEIKKLKKTIIFTDAAMCIDPDAEKKFAILQNVLSVSKALGIKTPKVAISSCVEEVNPRIKSTTDAIELKKMALEKKIDAIIDGPFAVDNILSKKMALEKKINSPVAGDADIILFPNIESANTFYKTLMVLEETDMVGNIIGAKAPIVLTSRVDSPNSKMLSILLAIKLSSYGFKKFNPMYFSHGIISLASTIRSHIYLVPTENNKYVAIDSSFNFVWNDVKDEIKELGIDMKNITDLFLTHSDVDHIGNAKRMMEECGCKVWMHQKEIDHFFEKSRKFKRFIFDQTDNWEDELIDIKHITPLPTNGKLPYGFTYKLLPGHTEGSVVYYFKDVVFIGDLAQTQAGKLMIIPDFFTIDKKEYLQSLKNLNLDGISLICPAHGKPCPVESTWKEFLDNVVSNETYSPNKNKNKDFIDWLKKNNYSITLEQKKVLESFSNIPEKEYEFIVKQYRLLKK